MRKAARKHPKTAATIVFFILVAIISFAVGYKQDRDRRDKNGNAYSTSHHIMNGLKWTGIVVAIIALLAGTMALVFQMSFWEMFFFGGDFINMVGQIVMALIGALSSN